MNKEDFVELCQECHGKRWVTDTARFIGYSSRHIHHILSEDTPIPKRMGAAAVAMAMQKRDKLNSLLERYDIKESVKVKKVIDE